MNRSGGFSNKLIYLAVIVVMLLPLYLLGQPATDASSLSGGQLTRMRSDLNLAEANLGEIDPASESMKLASLGLRGFAASLLWRKAEEFKRSHEWDRLSATLNQISNLQPHYENVWEHQAHNLSYNVSVEFDDYRQRYAWVKKGMDYLSEGVRRNRTAPRLIWYTGWFYGQKLGMSDEQTQFRELFSDDEPLHADLKDEGIDVDSPDARGPDGRPDNWLVGRLWLNRGYELVDGGLPLVGKTPVTFFEVGPKWRIQHAVAIEKEGVLDDRSKGAWERAADDWYGYGTRSLPTTDGATVQLAKVGDLYERRADLVSRFESVAGDTLATIRDEKARLLTPAEVYAMELAPEERTGDEAALAADAKRKMEIDFVSAAKQSPEDRQLKALEIAAQIRDVENMIGKNDIYRNQMNYEYWQVRCEAEQDDLMLAARRLLYDAKELYEESDLDGEIAKYEQAFEKWRAVYDKYPILVDDVSSDEVLEAIDRFRIATDQSELPQDFPLRIFYEMHVGEGAKDSEEYTRLLESNGEGTGTRLPRINVTRPYMGIGTEKEPAVPSMEERTLQAPAFLSEGETQPADKPASTDEPASTNEPASAEKPASADKPAEGGDITESADASKDGEASSGSEASSDGEKTDDGDELENASDGS